MSHHRRKPIVLIAAMAGACLALSIGCRRDTSSPNHLQNRDVGQENDVILKVEEFTYTNADFDRYVRGTAGNEKLTDISLSRLIDDFIEEKIVLEAARKQGLSLTEEEKKDYLDKLAGEIPAEEPAASPEESRDESLFDRPLIEKYNSPFIKDIQVQDEEIRAYYEQHKKDFLVSERVKVSQILLETENKAVEVLRQLEDSPEEDFRRIAREESAGPEAFRGGEMGVFKVGDLPYEMEKVVFSLEEGMLSRVVESSYGFHIFRLDKKYAPQLLSKEEAAPSIRRMILEGKIKDALASHLAELKSTLLWEFYPGKLSFVFQRNDQ